MRECEFKSRNGAKDTPWKQQLLQSGESEQWLRHKLEKSMEQQEKSIYWFSLIWVILLRWQIASLEALVITANYSST